MKVFLRLEEGVEYPSTGVEGNHEPPTWALGTKLRFSARALYSLNH